MKEFEFEKWFAGYVEKCQDKWTRLLVISMKELYKFIWKAALDSILDQFPIEGYHNNPIRQYISEELYGEQ